MKTIKAILIGIFLILFAGKVFAAELNFAVVNSQEVILSSKAYENFASQMDKYKKEFEAGLNKEQADLQKIEKDLIDKQSEYSKKEFDKRKADLEVKVANFRDKFQKANQKFEQTGQEVSKTITEAARVAITEIVKEKKYDVVYESMALLYFSPDRDLTKAVLEKLNAKLPKVSVKKPY